MTIAAIGTLAASAMSAASAGEKLGPPLGLAFRFTVKIGNLDLGSWQSCSGLKMDFAPLAVKAGGHYDGVRYLAGEVSYPKVVLKRPVSKADSKTLQGWLATQGRGWVDGGTASGDSAVVTLYDSYQKPVMKWTLANARPASWSGPDLDAGTTKVASEMLELVHEGFDVVVPGDAPAGALTAGGRAGPPTVSGPGGSVTFLFPPTEMAVTRTSEQPSQVLSTNLQGAPEASKDVTTYVLNNLYLEAADVSADVKKLATWAAKTSWAWKTVKSQKKLVPALPWLTYTWGAALPNVQLTYLSVTYVRFNASGAPTRAKVSIKLSEMEGQGASGSRNPSSGGIGGREARVVVAGDSLARLAEEKYGEARRWRELAEANGLDDALRLRPGRSVYLPAAGELSGRSR